MKKIKDILYDINDIIVVFAIIAAAALLIWFRIDAIMAYPSSGSYSLLASGEETEDGAASGEETAAGGNEDGGSDMAESAIPSDGGISVSDGEGGESPPSGTGEGSAGATSGQDAAQAERITEYSLYIAYGETAA